MDRPRITGDMIYKIVHSEEARAYDLIPDFSAYPSVDNASFVAYALGSPNAIKCWNNGQDRYEDLIAAMVSTSLADTLSVKRVYDIVTDIDTFKDVCKVDMDMTEDEIRAWRVKYPAIYEYLWREHVERMGGQLWALGPEFEENCQKHFSPLDAFIKEDISIRLELLTEADRVNFNDELQREPEKASQVDCLPVQVEDRAEEANKDDAQEEE